MPIEMQDLKELSDRQKKIYEHALKAAEQKNYGYGIEMLRDLLRKSPGCIEARMKLRDFQMDSIGNKPSLVRQILASIGCVPIYIRCEIALYRKKFEEALDLGEQAMTLDPTCQAACMILMRAAEAAEADVLVLMALEQANKYHPKSVFLLSALAEAYSRLNMGSKVLECRQKIKDFKPENMRYQEQLKEAVALAAMDSGGWNQVMTSDGKLDYRFLIKDKDEAQRLEQKERMVKGEDAVKNLIDERLRLLAENDTVENRKKLAELYVEISDWDSALEHYEKAIEVGGVQDPSIDQAVTNVLSKKFDAAIKEWREYVEREDIEEAERTNAKQQIADLAAQRQEMLVVRYGDRVRRYPNDMPDRYKYASLLFESGDVEEALKHFQTAQKNARFRIDATIFMGKCFAHKGQHDLAIDQFLSVIEELRVMNNQKKDLVYTLAKSYETVGKQDEAIAAYKEIYAADLNYRDVSDIIDRFYRKGGDEADAAVAS